MKRALIILLLIFQSQSAYASFWDSIGRCLKDPCNCGEKPITEYWGKQVIRPSVKKNKNCPPWDKYDGRSRYNCLMKKAMPGTFIESYKNLCGEKSPSSSYKTPRIRVRGQQCNALKCWSTSTSLDWDGDCVTLAGRYGLPLYRMCARIALPANTQTTPSIKADPGYTDGKHLDSKGKTQDDKYPVGKDGAPIKLSRPKLCLYLDPAFLSLESGLQADVMDIDPNWQPFHKTEAVHPIIQIIKTFFKVFKDSASGLASAISDLTASLGSSSDIATQSLSKAFEFLGTLIGIFGNAIEKLLDEVGAINRAVSSTKYGCVELPLGPMPPPFCSQISYFQLATLQKICQLDKDGKYEKSTNSSKCLVSAVRNNFVRNSVRVGYDHLVPLCKPGESPSHGTCAEINNLASTLTNAKALHEITKKRDIIKHCSAASSGELCAQTSIKHRCSVTEHGCRDGFRIVYAKKIGHNITPEPYFYDDLPNCTNNSPSACQVIWGINTAEFADISLVFPKVSNSANIVSAIKHSFRLFDYGLDTDGSTPPKENKFHATIVQQSHENQDYNFVQEPNQICLFGNKRMIDCTERVPAPQPLLSCNNVFGTNCKSSYFSPQATITYRSDDGRERSKQDVTSTLVVPETVYQSGGNRKAVAYLAGTQFEALVTDDNYAMNPFMNAPPLKDPTSILGTYLDNILPISLNPPYARNPYAVYMSGLEYISNKYHLGGKYICVRNKNMRQCPDDIHMCVLAKLANKNTVKCSIFYKSTENHPGLSMCSPDQARNPSCGVIDFMPKISGGRVNIKKCADGALCYESDAELCTVGMSAAERSIPGAQFGETLATNQHYNPFIKDARGIVRIRKYNQNSLRLRTKTLRELGACTLISPDPRQDTCSAQNNFSQDNGFASWTSVKVGEISTGTCKAGMKLFNPANPLKRLCIPVSEPAPPRFALEPLYRMKGTPPKKEYTNTKCVFDGCKVEGGFNAYWPAVKSGELSLGRCNLGYYRVSTPQRRCVQKSPGVFVLSFPDRRKGYCDRLGK
ncbi:MAG: hypothetical protein COA94_00595 [Rickettsiales bacterium]|nr:MAG: hypothetical protein COA94_00595 [Rickettsiales bacterium]